MRHVIFSKIRVGTNGKLEVKIGRQSGSCKFADSFAVVFSTDVYIYIYNYVELCRHWGHKALYGCNQDALVFACT